MGVDAGVRNITEPWSNHGSKRSFTNPAQPQAGQGNAKLNGRQELVEMLLDLADSTSADTTLLDQLLDARIADADHGEFRSNEKGVRCHKKNHQDDPQKDQGDHGLQSYTGGAFRQKERSRMFPEARHKIPRVAAVAIFPVLGQQSLIWLQLDSPISFPHRLAILTLLLAQQTDPYFSRFAFSATSALARSPISSDAGGSWFAKTTTVYGESSTIYRCVLTPGNPPPWPTTVREYTSAISMA